MAIYPPPPPPPPPWISNYIHYNVWHEIIYSHSQTSTVKVFKFGNRYKISFHTCLGIWLLIHVGIKVNPCLLNGPLIWDFITTTSSLAWWYHWIGYLLNTLRPRQNGRHLSDDVLKCNFLNEIVWIPINISLKFIRKGPINNIPALVQIMAWRHPGDKPLSEPMMVSLPMLMLGPGFC